MRDGPSPSSSRRKVMNNKPPLSRHLTASSSTYSGYHRPRHTAKNNDNKNNVRRVKSDDVNTNADATVVVDNKPPIIIREDRNTSSSTRPQLSNLPRASLHRHCSAPSNRRTRGQSIGDGDSVNEINSRLRNNLISSVSSRGSMEMMGEPNNNEMRATTRRSHRRRLDDEEEVEMYSSTTSSNEDDVSLSSKATALLTQLGAISKLDPYVKSPYFTNIFAKGLQKVHEYYDTGRDLIDVTDALYKCFDVSEDILNIIVASAKAMESSERQEDVEKDEHGDQVVRQLKPWETPKEQTDERELKPWETSMETTTPRDRYSMYQSSSSQFKTPSDLSGYSPTAERKKKLSVTTDRVHVPSLSLPPTPEAPGKDMTSPNEHIVALTMADNIYLPSTTPDDDEEASTASKESLRWPTSAEHKYGKKQEESKTTKAKYDKEQEEAKLARWEKQSRTRIQQYLNRVDVRINTVKSRPPPPPSIAVRPTLIQNRVQSHNVVPMDRNMGSHAAQSRPWDSFDGMSPAMGPGRQKQLFLPSLLSPSVPPTTTCVVMEEADPLDKEQQRKTSRLSVFRANAAVKEANEKLKEHTSQDLVPMMEESMDLPLDEAAADTPTTPYQTLPPWSRLMSGSNTFTTSHPASAGMMANMVSPEEVIKAYENSLGLYGIEDYKFLLENKTMEIARLEEKYKEHVEQSYKNLTEKGDELDHFRAAMKEAEDTVKSLEDTIHQLEQAGNNKDELVEILRRQAEKLEVELEQKAATTLEKEIDHQESVKTLNESISELCGDIKERDNTISDLQDHNSELETVLAKSKEDHNAVQTELAAAQKDIIDKDERIQSLQDELDTTKEQLQEQMELYRNEISSSLENTTQLMDLMSKEKDSLINSLHTKITMLEQSLTELSYEQDMGTLQHDGYTKELNDKIHNLALALTDKDKVIEMLKSEMKVSSAADAKKLASMKKKEKDRKMKEAARIIVSSSRSPRYEKTSSQTRHGRHHNHRHHHHHRSGSTPRSDRKKHNHRHHQRRAPNPERHSEHEYYSEPSGDGVNYYETRDDEDYVDDDTDSIFD